MRFDPASTRSEAERSVCHCHVRFLLTVNFLFDPKSKSGREMGRCRDKQTAAAVLEHDLLASGLSLFDSSFGGIEYHYD